jgi:hypothetical protein
MMPGHVPSGSSTTFGLVHGRTRSRGVLRQIHPGEQVFEPRQGDLLNGRMMTRSAHPQTGFWTVIGLPSFGFAADLD